MLSLGHLGGCQGRAVSCQLELVDSPLTGIVHGDASSMTIAVVGAPQPITRRAPETSAAFTDAIVGIAVAHIRAFHLRDQEKRNPPCPMGGKPLFTGPAITGRDCTSFLIDHLTHLCMGCVSCCGIIHPGTTSRTQATGAIRTRIPTVDSTTRGKMSVSQYTMHRGRQGGRPAPLCTLGRCIG